MFFVKPTVQEVNDCSALKTLRSVFARALSVSLIISAVATPGYSQIADNQRVRKAGLEVEFANEENISPKMDDVGDDQLTKLLDVVRRRYRDNNGALEVKKTTKNGREMRYGSYVDQDGREWMVVPESVNTSGVDGLEFVTPPIETRGDRRKLLRILEDMMSKRKVTKGVRSSTHHTYDVSDKIVFNGNPFVNKTIHPDANISKAVDTILGIESKWLEIYAAVSPQRYGTIANRFGVPLAVDQQDLLRELAALAPERRTYSTVQAIFRKHHAREILLKGGDETKAWKYRGANYGKFFGLTPDGKVVPVFEFRIADYNEPKRILADQEILASVIDNIDKLGPIRQFNNPFAGIKIEGNDLTPVNQRIANVSPESYQSFLKLIEADPADFPMWRSAEKKVEVVAKEGKVSGWLDKLISSYNFNRPFEIGGGIATMGAEAEARGGNVRKMVDEVQKKSRTDLFPFLDGTAKEEGTGNIEIRTIPADTLAEIERNLKTMKKTLGGDLRGFHEHIRVPVKVYDEIGREKVNAWLSRVSDVVSLWRLQYRMHYFALNTWSNARLSPLDVAQRGTVRVQVIDGSLDIEFRGFMGAADEIVDLTRLILIGLKNPQFIDGFENFQAVTHMAPKSLVDVMSDYIKKYENREITAEERALLAKLIQPTAAIDSTKMLWPLLSFERAPFLNSYQQSKIADANFEFAKSLRIVMRNELELKKYADEKELFKQFRHRVKRWSQQLDFHAIMESSILVQPGLYQDIKLSHDEIIKLAGSYKGKALIQKALAPMSLEELRELHDKAPKNSDIRTMISSRLTTHAQALKPMDIQLAFFSDDHARHTSAAEMLKTSKNAETEAILVKALKSRRKEMGLRAARVLVTLQKPSERLYKLAIKHEDAEVRRQAVNALQNIAGWDVGRKLLERAYEDKDSRVRLNAVDAAVHFPVANSMEEAAKRLRSSDADVGAKTAATLHKMKVDDISPLILDLLRDRESVNEKVIERALTAWRDFVDQAEEKRTPEEFAKLQTTIVRVLDATVAVVSPTLAAPVVETLSHVNFADASRLALDLQVQSSEHQKALVEAIRNSSNTDSLSGDLGTHLLEMFVMDAQAPEVRKEAFELLQGPRGNAGAGREAFKRSYLRFDSKTRLASVTARYFKNIGYERLLEVMDLEKEPKLKSVILRVAMDHQQTLTYGTPAYRAAVTLMARALNSDKPNTREDAITRMRSSRDLALITSVGQEVVAMRSSVGIREFAKALITSSINKMVTGAEGESKQYSEMLIESLLKSSPNEAPRFANFLATLPTEQFNELSGRLMRPESSRLVRLTIMASLLKREAGEVPGDLVRRGLMDSDPKIRAISAKLPGAIETMGTLTRGARANSCRAIFLKAL